MKDDNSKEVKIVQEIKLDNLKNLIRSAYLLGQMQGLNGNLLSNPKTISEREFLVQLLSSIHIIK